MADVNPPPERCNPPNRPPSDPRNAASEGLWSSGALTVHFSHSTTHRPDQGPKGRQAGRRCESDPARA